MKTTLAKVASALSFAHLAGLGRGKAAKAEDDEDDKKERDHEDGNVKKGSASEDDKKDDDNRECAEDDDPDSKAEAEDKDPKDDEDDKKKSKSKSGDDSEDDEKMQAATTKERARCAAIFASPAAAKNVAMAAELAFQTDLSSARAIALLEKSGAPAGASPQRRNPALGAGSAESPNSQQAVAQGWDRAFKSVAPRR